MSVKRTAGKLAVTLCCAAAIVGVVGCGDSDERVGTNGAPATTGGGSAKSVLDQIKQRGTMVVAVDSKFAPYGTLSPDGSYTGINIDIGNQIAKDLGVKVKYVAPDTALIIGGGWSGRWDLGIVGTTPTLPRQKVVNVSSPVEFGVIRMAVTDDADYDSLASLSGKKVGVAAGTTLETYLKGGIELPDIPYDGKGKRIQGLVKDAKIKEYPSDTDALADLKLGNGKRLDAVLTVQAVIDEAARKGLKIKGIGAPAWLDPATIAADKKADSASLIAAVNASIAKMAASGQLQQIYDKYKVKTTAGGLAAYTAALAEGGVTGALANVQYTTALP